MGKYVTRKELESLVDSLNKALFGLDIMIEVIATEYCKADKSDIDKYTHEYAKKRIENAKIETQTPKKEE